MLLFACSLYWLESILGALCWFTPINSVAIGSDKLGCRSEFFSTGVSVAFSRPIFSEHISKGKPMRGYKDVEKERNISYRIVMQKHDKRSCQFDMYDVIPGGSFCSLNSFVAVTDNSLLLDGLAFGLITWAQVLSGCSGTSFK